MKIINAKIYTMSDLGVIENGYIEINDGKITAVGGMSQCDPSGDVIDAKGMYVLPGMVDAHTHIGIWEECLGQEGDDTNEDSDTNTSNVRAIDGINSRDVSFGDALKAGITTVVSGPGSANPIGGQFLAMKTYGEYVDEMIVKEPSHMKFALGENPKKVYGEKESAPVTRMATAAIIRENLIKAREYSEKLDRAAEDEDTDKPDYDMKLDALIPVIKGELPAHFHAHRADDILTAIRIAKEFDLKFAIVHGTESMYITRALEKLCGNEKFLGVITGPLLGTRSKPELANMTFDMPAIISKHGVNTALCTDHQIIPEEYLMLCAALAKKHGMSELDAIASVTINAAKAADIADRVGSIEAGKDADIVIYDRHPFDIFSETVKVIVNGEIAYEP